MGKILLVIFGIFVFIVGAPILFQILQGIFAFAFAVALFIIVVGGAFLVLRNIFRG